MLSQSFSEVLAEQAYARYCSATCSSIGMLSRPTRQHLTAVDLPASEEYWVSKQVSRTPISSHKLL